MDFVVVGFGLGALGILLGVVLLGLLAPRSQHAAMRAPSPHDAAHDLAVAAEHRGTGQAFLYAGAAMLLATVGGLAGALDDRTGALLVTTTATVAVIGILLGGYLHRVRNPAPPRRRTRPAAVTETAVLTAPSPGAARSLLTGAASPSGEDVGETAGDDAGNVGADPVAAPGPVPEAAYAEAASPNLPPADGESAPPAREREPEAGAPVAAAAPGAERGPATDPPHGRRGDDPELAKEEETVGIGLVVPPVRATRSPPSRRDEGEDPS